MIDFKAILKPKNLYTFSNTLFKPLLFMAIICIALGYFFVFSMGDVDYQQDIIFKLLYVHVPASWWALGIYAIMSGCALLGFITRVPQFHLMAKFWALPGIIFTLLSLISGMIWGHYTWGTFWVWDARLTTMFIQFLIYLSYVLLVFSKSGNDEKKYSVGSIMLLIGFINLPIIKWSVDWWFTLHQPASILFVGKNQIHSTFITPLILNTLGFFFWAFAIVCLQGRRK